MGIKEKGVGGSRRKIHRIMLSWERYYKHQYIKWKTFNKHSPTVIYTIKNKKLNCDFKRIFHCFNNNNNNKQKKWNCEGVNIMLRAGHSVPLRFNFDSMMGRKYFCNCKYRARPTISHLSLISIIILTIRECDRLINGLKVRQCDNLFDYYHDCKM